MSLRTMDKTRLLCLLIIASIVHDVNSQGQLLCANRETVRKLDLKTERYTTILTKLKRSVAVDFHYEKNLIVWTDVVTEKIYSSSMSTTDGPKSILVEVCVTPDGLAVDWIHDNLYWTDTGKDVIGVSRLDGNYITTLFDKELDEPRAIVLDPRKGVMFWTDWGSRPKIEQSGMDGSYRKAIVTSGIKWPNGLAIDLFTQTLYWVDGMTHVLSSSDYNGNNIRVLIDSPTIMRHPFALDILGDFLFWTEWSTFRESVYKVNKSSGEGATKVVSGNEWSSLMGIRAYDRTKQIPGVNKCGDNNGGCTHLCLPAPWQLVFQTHSCLCPDGHLDSDNCSTVPMNISDGFLSPSQGMEDHRLSTTESVLGVSFENVDTKTDSAAIAWGNSTNERHNQEILEISSMPSGAIIGIFVGLLVLALVIYFIHNKFSGRASEAALKSEGWTGLDNPVYSVTTEVREPALV